MNNHKRKTQICQRVNISFYDGVFELIFLRKDLENRVFLKFSVKFMSFVLKARPRKARGLLWHVTKSHYVILVPFGCWKDFYQAFMQKIFRNQALFGFAQLNVTLNSFVFPSGIPTYRNFFRQTQRLSFMKWLFSVSISILLDSLFQRKQIEIYVSF